MKEVKIKKLDGRAQFPVYSTPGAAAADLRAVLDGELIIEPGQRAKIPTGLSLELPDAGTVAVLCARSGLAAKHGICLANGIGVIDSDYRGEICVALINLGNEAFTVCPGDRIAQIMFMPVEQAKFVLCEELGDTERGEGGFGSTGTK